MKNTGFYITGPKYFKEMLEHFNLRSEEVVYFEHNQKAVKSAESVGIKSFYYDPKKRNLKSLNKFLEENI